MFVSAKLIEFCRANPTDNLHSIEDISIPGGCGSRRKIAL